LRPPDRCAPKPAATPDAIMARPSDVSAAARPDWPSGPDLTERCQLVVPMLRDNEPIGAITVSRADTGQFSESHIALLRTRPSGQEIRAAGDPRPDAILQRRP